MGVCYSSVPASTASSSAGNPPSSLDVWLQNVMECAVAVKDQAMTACSVSAECGTIMPADIEHLDTLSIVEEEQDARDDNWNESGFYFYREEQEEPKEDQKYGFLSGKTITLRQNSSGRNGQPTMCPRNIPHSTF